jgi:hypothetical protein
MSAPKYVLFTDHLAHANTLDRFIATNAKSFLDAFDTACRYITDDIYLIRIYERVPNRSGKKYIRVANLRADRTLEHKTDNTYTDIGDMGIMLYEA